MGTVFQVPWGRVDSVEKLRAHGFVTAALALEPDAVALDDPALRRIDKLALVLGSEGYGLDGATIEACDLSVIIPMEHEVDSLNVAAASAVAFWELRARCLLYTSKPRGTEEWQLVRDYSPASSAIWNPDARGTYDIRINVRARGSDVDYDHFNTAQVIY